MSKELRFDDKVAIVTGAGNGLGKSHALLLASRGAKVVVNDLGGDIHGDGNRSSAAADAVVEEIKAAGGEAVANYDSVTDGDKIVQTAMDAFGTVDIVINNAGILRDVSFAKMTDKDFDLILDVHLKGTYSVTHAAWPIMKEKGYGRIIMTTSAAGIYGNFGQANYCAAKLGITGLANSLAIEGRKANICVNTIAPIAGSRLTETVLPPDLIEKLKPEYVSPLVAWLTHEGCEETGGLYEVGAGFIGKLRWQRSSHGVFNTANDLSPEQVEASWNKVTDFTDADNPTDINGAMGAMLTAMNNPPLGGNQYIDLDAASKDKIVGEVEYGERDLALYALGIGAARDAGDKSELKYVYELGDGFMAQPTYAAMPALNNYLENAKNGRSMAGFNFGLDRVLHGEQYTEVYRPLDREAKLTNTFTFKTAYDKDPHAIAIMAVDTVDEHGEKIAYNEISLFVRGGGGWGGERGPGNEENAAPNREPDAVTEEATDANQTLLYRLSGDWNPLHADPDFAKAFGFDKPILHGMCTFGYCGRHVIKAFADNDGRYFKSIKVRFAKSVYPGDTLVTKMWQESPTRIIFETRVKERDEVVISNAAVELYEEIPVAKARPADSQAVANQTGSLAGSIESGEPETADVITMLQQYIDENSELVGQVGKVFQWNVKNPATDFVLDLKNGSGSATTGTAEHDCSVELDEEVLMSMMRGEADAQKLYFAGKLKIGGDIMASQKLQFLADMDAAETQRRLQNAVDARVGSAVGDGVDAAADSAGSSAAGATQVVGFLQHYVSAHPELVEQVGKVFQWNVKNPDTSFVLDLKNGSGSVTTGTADHDCSVELDEEVLMSMMRGEADAQKLYFSGKLKIGGDIMASQKLQFLADIDPAEVQAGLNAAAGKPKQQAADEKPAAAKDLQSPAIFAALEQRLASDKSAANGAAGVLQFNVTDTEQSWTVDLSGDAATVQQGAANDPTAIIAIGDADLAALAAGNAELKDLFQRGQLRVDGDTSQARQLGFLKGLI